MIVGISHKSGLDLISAYVDMVSSVSTHVRLLLCIFTVLCRPVIYRQLVW